MVVLIVAVLALQNPKGTSSNAGAGGSSVVRSVNPSTPVTRTPTRAATSPSARTSPVASISGGSTSRASTSPVSASHLPLVVLNNSTTSGLARQAAQQFEAAGWSVTDTGNLTNDIVSTCAYYDPADASALAAAEALQQQFPAIKRIKPKFAELPSGPIVVVLTSDFTLG